MQGAKISRREHLEAIYKQTGELPAELDVPDVPENVAHIWAWFLELSTARNEGAISFTEIRNWAELTGREVRPWEVRAIKKLDIMYLESRDNGT